MSNKVVFTLLAIFNIACWALVIYFIGLGMK
jgi:hypothetical protein